MRVPAENLLGEIGKGHKVAFNVLNFGRFKLGAMCGGGAKQAIGESARYAAERKQFGQPIASFGAIKHKLGEMIVRTYAVESLLYRTAGMIDARIGQTTHNPADSSAALAALEEYAIEASIAKVAGSEVLNDVLDENIQMHGGNGYVRDYPAERHYRDSRVNRIFEGTNEINRLLISGILARRAVKGDLPIIAAAKALQDELMGPPAPSVDRRRSIGRREARGRSVQEDRADGDGAGAADLRSEARRRAGSADARDRHSDRRVRRRQRGSSRDRRRPPRKSSRAALHVDAARVFVSDAAIRIDGCARQALAAMSRRRQAANGSGRAPASLEADTRQYRCAAAPAG